RFRKPKKSWISQISDFAKWNVEPILQDVLEINDLWHIPLFDQFSPPACSEFPLMEPSPRLCCKRSNLACPTPNSKSVHSAFFVAFQSRIPDNSPLIPRHPNRSPGVAPCFSRPGTRNLRAKSGFAISPNYWNWKTGLSPPPRHLTRSSIRWGMLHLLPL